VGLRQFLSCRRARRALTSIVFLTAVVGALTGAPSALAAACSAGAVTPMHSPDGTARPFYGDWSHSSTKHSGYVGYELSSSLGSDLWIKLSGFAGGSIGLAANQSASIPARATSQTGKPLVYAYLTASADTTTAQSWTVEVWNGKPGQTGSTQVCTTGDGFSSVIDVLSAGANKITSISVSTSSPAIGGSFDVTAVGDTGTMGAGDASDQSGGNGVFSMAPAMDDSWPADSFLLAGVSVTIGGTTTRDKLRIYPGTSAAGAYTTLYKFVVRKAPASATAVYPVQNIASGTQVKYTGTYPSTTTSIAVPTVTTTLVKSTQSLSGPPYLLTYQVVASNTSASATVLDYLRDTPTSASAWSFATGTAKLNGSAIPDPVNDAGTLVFSGPFTVPAASGGTAGTLTFLYTLSVAGTVSNSVVGQVGDVLLGGTNAGDNEVTVNPVLPAVTTASLSDATVGGAYSVTLGATGGTSPYTWSVLSGSLPAGLSLNPLTGVLSGTPTTAGSSSFTIAVTDATTASSSRAFTITTAAASSGPGDSVAPGGSLSIDGGAATTTSTSLTLALAATDAVGVTAYRVAEGTDCSGASWVAVASATSFSASVGFTVSGGDGAKTVCVQYSDAAANVSNTSTATITLDAAPTVALATTAPDPTSGAFVVTATFSKAVTGFTAGDVAVANGTASAFSGSGASYTFTVTASAQGAVTVDVGAGAATSAAGTANVAATQLSRTFDSALPTVTLSSPSVTPVNGSFSVTATFSESVTGFVLGGVAVTNGTASNLAGSGATYTFDVAPAADGVVTIAVGAGAAADAAGNTNTAATPLTRTYDGTRPGTTLSSAAASTVGGAFSVTLTFGESVTGLTLGGIAVTNGAASNLAGSGATYTFDVTPTTDGTVSVTAAAGSATDAAGNTSTASAALTRVADLTAPSLTLSSAAPNPTNGAFSVTATFSESVAGFTLGDVAIGSGTASGLAGSGASYTFTVGPSAEGAVSVDVAAGAALDAGGNSSLAATTLTRAYDSVRPSVALSSSSVDPVKGSFTVTVTFSESVTGLSLGSGVSVGNGTASNLAGSGTTYTFEVAPSVDGAVTVDLAAGATADAAGNGNTAAARLSRTFDGTRPSVTLSTTAADPTNGPFTVTATFSESVTGLTLGGVGVTNGIASNLAGSGTSYTFDVAPSADGSVTVTVGAGAAADAAGNTSTAATALTRDYDGTRPTVTLASAAAGSVNGAFAVTATFSKPVTGLTLAKLAIGGGAASHLTGSGSGSAYTFDVTPSAQGIVTVDLAAGAASDAAGNTSLAATPLARTYDSVRPTVTLTAGAPTEGVYAVTATFSEAVTGFALGDVGVANGHASGLAGSGAVYTFDVAASADGVVTVTVDDAAAADAAGNASSAATTFAKSFASRPPTIALTRHPDARTGETTAGFGFTVDGADDVTCSLDGDAEQACTTRFDATGLGVGAHALLIRARNRWGAVATARFAWTIVAPPGVLFTLRPPDESQSDGVFTWRSDAPGISFSCALDGAAFSGCSSPVFFTDLEDGTHTFTVRADDGVAVSTGSVTWTVRRHATPPPASVVILPKIRATDMEGRPQPFKTAADTARSKGPFTRKLEVELRIPTPENVGSDVVYISNYDDFRDVRVFPIAADELYDWDLLAGPSGDRPVWIRFSDGPDAAVGRATIVLDQELPTLKPTFLGIGRTAPGSHARGATASGPACGGAARRWLRIGGADRFSGLNAVQVASDTHHPCAWRPFLPKFSYRLPSRLVYVRVVDRVGNISDWYRVVTRR
jgi:hypothetical protein